MELNRETAMRLIKARVYDEYQRRIDEEKGELGKVQEIIEYPTQSLIQILINGKEVLIPIHDDIIQDVNREEKKIYIKAPNGLIDMYLEN